jgi:DNA-binding beta-propeller fold protein YncE
LRDIVSWLALCAALSLPAAHAGAAGYVLTGRIPGGAGEAWDYAAIDPAGGKLYLAQAGITALDLKDRSVTGGLVHAKLSHGVAVLGEDRFAVDDSTSKEVMVFDSEGKILATIPTAPDNPVNGLHALDALVLEPRSGLLVAVNGESGLLLLIDVARARVAGTISVGGHPEFAVADGRGTIYINVNRGKRSEIGAVDVAARTVTKRYPLARCEGATGLAYDESARLLLAVCDNGIFKAIAADSGRMAASLKVGAGADAIMWDPRRRTAFVASGDSGTLSIISVRSASDLALVQVLQTQRGTRLGAVDVNTGILYLPAARFGPPKPPIPYPSVVPGSFEFLVISPN